MKCPALVGGLKDFARRRFISASSPYCLSSGAVPSIWYTNAPPITSIRVGAAAPKPNSPSQLPKVASWAAFRVSNTRIENGADAATARSIGGLEDGIHEGFVRWRASVRRFSGPPKFSALQAAEYFGDSEAAGLSERETS